MARKLRETQPAKPGVKAPSRSDQPIGDESLVQRRCHVAAAVVTVILLIFVAAMSTTHVLWSTDSFTDLNILMAGDNFATHGFLKLHLLPVHYWTPSAESPAYYMHYPPLPDLMNGVMRVMGIESLSVMRFLCGTLYVAGLVSVYLAFAPVIGPVAAVCGLGFLGTTGFFFAYAISLHHAYNVLFLGLFLLFFMKAVLSKQQTTRLWACAWVALFFESLSSFEFILYPQAFAWVYVLATGQLRRRWKPLLILATAPVLGVGLHFLQNCWAIGFSAALADNFCYNDYLDEGRWHWLKQIPDALWRESRRRFYWPWPVLPLVGLAVLMPSHRLQRNNEPRYQAGALLLALVVAATMWYVFMPPHAVIHGHTINQLFPLVFVVMGWMTALVGQWLIQREQSLPIRILAALVLLVLIGGQVHTITSRLDEWKPGIPSVMEAMGPEALPPKTGVLTNVGVEAHFAYFLRRPSWRAPRFDREFPECLDDLKKHLPGDWPLQYYVLFGANNKELFQLLASNCPGRRLVIPQMKQLLVALFDINQLHLPPAQRTPLPDQQKKDQLRGLFPEWKIPGFQERLSRILSQFGNRNQE